LGSGVGYWDTDTSWLNFYGISITSFVAEI
jgi:hypothetical protein